MSGAVKKPFKLGKKMADPIGFAGVLQKADPTGLLAKADPGNLLGMGKGKPAEAVATTDAAAEASAADKLMGATDRQTVLQRAIGASVALANEDREVLGAKSKLGVKSSTKKKLQVLE